MKYILIALAFTIFIVPEGFSQLQRNCGSEENLEFLRLSDPGIDSRMQDIERDIQKWLEENPEAKTSSVITIPVVVHVVWNTAA